MHRISFLLGVAALVEGYDYGQDITLCWVTPVNGSATRTSCNGADVIYTRAPADDMVGGEEYSVQWSMTVPVALNPTSAVPHANIHSCYRSVGFCSPFVGNTPGLATHSSALTGALTVSGSQEVAAFTTEIQLGPGQYTIIAHCRWYDTAGAQHNMARAIIRDVAEPIDISFYISIGLGSGLGAIFLILLVQAIRTHVRRVHALEKRSEAAFQDRLQRVRDACDNASTLAFPMCAINYNDFKSHGKLVTYEHARSINQLIVFDKASEVLDARNSKKHIAFISHQWKGVRISYPDPTGSDYRAIVTGLDSLIASKNLEPSDVLVWIDITSIPQQNVALQKLSIASLPVYASFSNFFLISAPPTVNPNSGDTFDLATYIKRGWCRLEQWARITQCGVDDMYVLEGGEPRTVSDDFNLLKTAMNVYTDGATFSVDTDKAALVNTSIALFHLLLKRNMAGSLDGLPRRLLEEARKLKTSIYPEAYFDDLIFITESLTTEGVAERVSVTRSKTKRLSAKDETFKTATTTSSLTQLVSV